MAKHCQRQFPIGTILPLLTLIISLIALPVAAQHTPLRQPLQFMISKCIVPFPETIEAIRRGCTIKKDSTGYTFPPLEMAESANILLKMKLATHVPVDLPKETGTVSDVTPSETQKKGVTLEEVMSNPETRQKMSVLTSEEKIEYLKSLNITTAETPKTSKKALVSKQELSKEEKTSLQQILGVNTCMNSISNCAAGKELPILVNLLDTASAKILFTHNELDKESITKIRKAYKDANENKTIFEKKSEEIIHEYAAKHEKAYTEQLKDVAKKVDDAKEKILSLVGDAQKDIDILNYGDTSSEASKEIAELQEYTRDWCGKILEIESKLIRKCTEDITVQARIQRNKQLLYGYVK